MASFTDAISTFNPYVQQLPVDLMAKVGMQKQAQYDAGVQKIQQQIDNVAGLDVAHDADKVYLQSKLGQLGNNLKVVAGGDFSNQQLVNSVGGMATQIVKDPLIQNAVASTARYKKYKEQLEKDYQAGKSSIANVSDFDDQVNAWLSTNKPGQVFKGRYSPYIDLDKKFLETFKALHASETGKDFIYERYTDPITGKLLSTDKLAAAMEREGVEGINAYKIEAALRASLTPDDLNQMRINANYQFKGVTPEQLTSSASKQYANALNRADEEIERLKGIAALSDAQPMLQKRALTSIEEIRQRKKKLGEDYNEQVADILANPDKAKLNIYKEGAIGQFANAFSWEKKVTQVVENPQLSAQIALERLQTEKANYRLNVRKQNFSEYMENRKQTWEETKYAKDHPVYDPFLTSLGEATKDLPAPLTALAQSTVAANKSIDDNIKLLLNNIPDLHGNRAELQNRLLKFQNGDLSQFGGNLRSTAQAIIDGRKLVRENAYAEKFAREEAESDPVIAANKKRLEAAIASRTGISLVVNGVRQTLSPQEVYDFARKFQHITTETPGGTVNASSPGKGYYGILDPTTLNTKERAFYNQYINGNSDIKRAIHGKLMGFSDIINAYEGHSKSVDSQVNDILGKRMGKYAPLVENIKTDKSDERARYENVLGTVLTRYVPGITGSEAVGGDVYLTPEKVAKAKEWLKGTDKNDIQYKMVTQGNNRYIAAMLGTETIMVKLTPFEANQLPSSTDTYGRSILDKQVAFKGSTNPTGDASDAEYSVSFFKNVKKYPVVADLKHDPQLPESNYINLQIKIGDSWQPVQLDENPMTAVEARKILSTWTDADSERILKRKGISIK